MENKNTPSTPNIKIVDYDSKYRTDFKALNQAWIEQYFKMEESDYKALDNPESYILKNGGAIVVALCENETAGVCALIKMEEGKHDFEMAKMAVAPKFQGKGIGFILGNAVIAKAKMLGAKSIYLESNSVLEAALRLYQKLGFQDVEGVCSPYARCNVQMELNLDGASS